MTRLFLTGFELATSANTRLFDSYSATALTTSYLGPRSGRNCFNCSTAGTSNRRCHWDNRRWPGETELYFRIALQTSGTLRDNAVFSIEDDGGTVLAQVRHDKKIYGRIGGSLSEVTGFSWSIGNYAVIEFHIKIHATQGIWELRVDGVTIDSNVNVDTTGAGTFFGNVQFGAYESFNDVWRADDFGVNNTEGASSNSWCGLGGIKGLRPTANGSVIQFSPLAPDTNYENVNDNILDYETYNQAVALGNVDVFETEDLPAGDYAIVAVGMAVAGVLASAGGDSAICVVRDGGVMLEYTDHAKIFEQYNHNWQVNYAVFPLAPDGGSWSVAKVNSAEFGYKAVTP